LLTSSDKANMQSEEIKATDIKEIWKPVSYISKAMPLPEISMESIQNKVDNLKTARFHSRFSSQKVILDGLVRYDFPNSNQNSSPKFKNKPVFFGIFSVAFS
jgi:hypothetical protein